MIEQILAIGILTFLLIFLANSLDKEHFILKLLMIVTALAIMILIPKTTIEQKCEVVLDWERTAYTYGDNYSSYHWDYKSAPPACPPNNLDCVNLFHTNTTKKWTHYCYPITDGASNILFYKTFLWFFVSFWLYLFGYFTYKVLLHYGIVALGKK